MRNRAGRPRQRRDAGQDDQRLDASEDFASLHNRALLRRLREARREQLSGATRSWEEFRHESASDLPPAPFSAGGRLCRTL